MRKYYHKNKEKCSKISKKWAVENPKKRRMINKIFEKHTLISWEGCIPKITQCQMCGRDIFFNNNNLKDAINFDHRYGGTESIKGSPTSWLRFHKRTPENEAIWKSCDFGMICHRCNIILPTMDRQLYLVNVTKYINRSTKKEVADE